MPTQHKYEIILLTIVYYSMHREYNTIRKESEYSKSPHIHQPCLLTLPCPKSILSKQNKNVKSKPCLYLHIIPSFFLPTSNHYPLLNFFASLIHTLILLLSMKLYLETIHRHAPQYCFFQIVLNFIQISFFNLLF